MLPAGPSFFNSVSTGLTSVKRRLPLLSSTILLATGSFLLNFYFQQKIEKGEVNWDYYSQEPNQIAWLILASLALAYNLEKGITLMKKETEHNPSNRLSALKSFGTTTTSCFSLSFVKQSLNAPITGENCGFVIGSAVMEGLQGGSLMFTGNYFIKKLHITIRPFNFEHVKCVGVGILLSTVQDLLDFICGQMIKSNSADWDLYIFPTRLFIWHAIIISLQGTLCGFTFWGFSKYANLKTEHHALNVFQKVIFPILPALSTLFIFAQLALTTPIDEKNGGYIALDSMLKGFFYGLVNAAQVCMTIGLFRRQAEQTLPLQASSSLIDDLPTSDPMNVGMRIG